MEGLCLTSKYGVADGIRRPSVAFRTALPSAAPCGSATRPAFRMLLLVASSGAQFESLLLQHTTKSPVQRTRLFVKWGLLMDTSRVCKPFRVKLLTTFHRRRYGVLQASIGLPLPEIVPRSAPPKNFVLEAIRVKKFMAAHPEETCLSAASKLNLHRKRISKFLMIANNLPQNIITELANCNDPKKLRKMTLNRLLYLSENQITK